MGSKFSMPTGVQKPPAVCKKPPPPSDVPLPPFNETYYQGFVQWNNPAYSFHPDLTGYVTMAPDAPPTQHAGDLDGYAFSLELIMTPNPSLPALQFRMNLYYYGLLLTFREAAIPAPKTLDPLDTGLILFPADSPADIISCRVYA